MSVIKCVYIEIADEDFWPLILTDLHSDVQVRGIYDASDVDPMVAQHHDLFDIEAHMEEK